MQQNTTYARYTTSNLLVHLTNVECREKSCFASHFYFKKKSIFNTYKAEYFKVFAVLILNIMAGETQKFSISDF